ncbi:MAG: ATP-binding cassette domain-containing protein [Puniceicoccales bacterium]|jgi:peptide/nickel transport system ATP-binding protein/oligopeptide transport system ATP-binding protein|nr:ATP-binding cassette domain-containing protein [Puniceicoccales bacterium]
MPPIKAELAHTRNLETFRVRGVISLCQKGETDASFCAMELLRVENLTVCYPRRAGLFGRRGRGIVVVKGVSFEVARGQTVALVGESGSGKTTIGRALLKLAPVCGGKIFFDGKDVTALSASEFFPWRKRLQMIFQDPWHSLNPCHTVGSILSEPIETHFRGMDAVGRRKRVAELLSRVRLPMGTAARYPHELSGGQRQRVGIARALAVEPELIICDEPVSALDVFSQAQIIQLIEELRKECGFSCLFISHDLALVEQISQRVLVMRHGEIVEQGTPEELYTRPRHAYTRELIDAVPAF